MEFEPIGIVRSPVHEGIDEGWGDIVSEIVVRDDLVEGLRGLDAFSHAVILFVMHRSSFDSAADLMRHPRGREDMPLVGCFSQRAKHRPNPIGITVVDIVGVAGSILTVLGLDAIDGSPVLDIKPYVPQFDRPASPSVPEWIDRLMEGYF